MFPIFGTSVRRTIFLLLAAGTLWVPAVAAEPETAYASGQIRIQLTPRNSVLLSSELAGRIDELPMREGESFEAGQLLLGFDCKLHQGRLAKAEAELQEARMTSEVNAQLDKLGSVSILDRDVSTARLAAAEAEVTIMQALVERCRINAPFPGRVAELKVKRYQYVAEGEPLLEILDDAELEVEMILPSPWLKWLKVGRTFSVHIDETRRSYRAEVSRITPRIDPVSQTVKVFGALKNKAPELRAGMSGTAALSP